MKVHQIPPSGLIAFRGRVNTLKRMGVVPSSGGRGRKINYSGHDVLLLAFCLQLLEYGMDPSVIAALATNIGAYVSDAAKKEHEFGEDAYVAFFPTILTGEITSNISPENKGIGALALFILPEREVTATKLREKLTPQANIPGADHLNKHAAKRIAAINVSELMRDIDAAMPDEAA